MDEKQILDALVEEATNCLNSSEETSKKEYEYRRKIKKMNWQTSSSTGCHNLSENQVL
ncbi:hypothetical protein K7432_015831 [Basidiobolus ranarum]|uniref:Uncharacterized protein n=1 Tax=Basidiobolus ranarum TaxID=34480 RepID=A0ABR2WFR1_9FUNG